VGAGEITPGQANPTANFLAEQFGGGLSHPDQYTINIGRPSSWRQAPAPHHSATAQTKVTTHELADLRRQIDFQVRRPSRILVAKDALALSEQNLSALDELEKIQRLRAEKGDLSAWTLEDPGAALRFRARRRRCPSGAESSKIGLRSLIGADKVTDDFDAAGSLELGNPLHTVELSAGPSTRARTSRAAEAARNRPRPTSTSQGANAWWDVTPQVDTSVSGRTTPSASGSDCPPYLRPQPGRDRADPGRRPPGGRRARCRGDPGLSEVDTALAAVDTERGKVEVLRDTYLPKAKAGARDGRIRLPARRVSLLDYLDAQRTYRETALQYLQALGNYQTASTFSKPPWAHPWGSKMRIVLIMVLVGALAAGARMPSPRKPPPPRSGHHTQSPVRIVQAEPRTRTAVLETTGKVQFNEEQLVASMLRSRVGYSRFSRRRERPVEPGTASLSSTARSRPGQERLLPKPSRISSGREGDQARARALRDQGHCREGSAEAENDYNKAMAERERAASRLRTLGVKPEQLKDIAARATPPPPSRCGSAWRDHRRAQYHPRPGGAYGQSDTPVQPFVIANLSTMWTSPTCMSPTYSRVRLARRPRHPPLLSPGSPRGQGRNIGAANRQGHRTLKIRVVGRTSAARSRRRCSSRPPSRRAPRRS